MIARLFSYATLFLLPLLAVACASEPPPAPPTPDIEATVTAMVEALPTQPPPPTLAALPTYTPAPPATPRPTLEPLPTYTPYPTLEPSPRCPRIRPCPHSSRYRPTRPIPHRPLPCPRPPRRRDLLGRLQPPHGQPPVRPGRQHPSPASGSPPATGAKT